MLFSPLFVLPSCKKYWHVPISQSMRSAVEKKVNATFDTDKTCPGQVKTIAFAWSIFLTPVVFALLYSVHGGLAHTKSKCHFKISVFISAFFKFNEITLKPIAFATVPTLPVPLNISNKFIIKDI